MRIGDLLEKLENLSWRIRPRLPFTSLNTVWRSLDKNGESILDVGCGEGRPMNFINGHRDLCALGVDIFEPCLKQCQESNIYWGLVRASVTKLPLKAKSFDTVLAMEIVEHLEKEAGQEMLMVMEKIARRQVIISTPVGECQPGALGSNPYQEHKSSWCPAEFKCLGYKVRGHGLRCLFVPGRANKFLPRLLILLANILWVCAGPFVYFLPGLAGDMVCIKTLEEPT